MLTSKLPIKKFENMPLIMAEPSQINYDVDLLTIEKDDLPKDNLMGDLMMQRSIIWDGALSGYFPDFNESLTLFYSNSNAILHRMKQEDHGPYTTYHLIDGVPTMRTGPHPKEPPIKHDTRIVFSKNSIFYCFNKKFDGTSLAECSSEELRKRRIAEMAIKQSIINIFRRRSKKHIYINGNDILIENKKICGGEVYAFDHVYHEHGHCNWLYEPELIERYLKDDKNHIASMKKRDEQIKNSESNGSIIGSFAGITGIANEIPGYTKEEFATDFLKEMQLFIFMI